MSWQAVEAVQERSRARGGARLVLLAIASHADPETGEAWPSLATIAQKAGLGVRQTQVHLRRLETSGELFTTLGQGRNHTTRYRITCLEKVQSSAPIEPGEKVQFPAEKVQDRVKKVQFRAEKVQSSAPEPSGTIIEPSREPPEAGGFAAPVIILPDGRTLTAEQVQAMADQLAGQAAERQAADAAPADAGQGEAPAVPGNPVSAPSRAKPATAGKKVPPAAAELPADLAALPGLPAAWDRWMMYRRERRLATAPSTVTGMFNRLRQFYREGHDPAGVIQNSIDNGWQGLFPHRTENLKFTRPDPNAARRAELAERYGTAEPDPDEARARMLARYSGAKHA